MCLRLVEKQHIRDASMISCMHKTNEPNSRRRNEMSYIEIDDCKNDMLLSISNKCVDSVKSTTNTFSLSKLTATGTSKQRWFFCVSRVPCTFAFALCVHSVVILFHTALRSPRR